MNNSKWFLPLFLLSASAVFANTKCKEVPQCNPYKPQGWSLDIGGDYTWMSFSTPPTYRGSTGGVIAKLTNEEPNAVFSQARTVYNLGTLKSSKNKTRFREWYSESVGGYCFSPSENWIITPYAGVGMDFLTDHHTGYSTVSPIKLNYTIFYALVGLKAHYNWENWMVGLQVDCFPTYNQYLKIRGLSGIAQTLKNRTGAEAQLPFAYRYFKNFWLEFAPYYRYLPIGASHHLGLPHRNLNQWGIFVSFRFFL